MKSEFKYPEPSPEPSLLVGNTEGSLDPLVLLTAFFSFLKMYPNKIYVLYNNNGPYAFVSNIHMAKVISATDGSNYKLINFIPPINFDIPVELQPISNYESVYNPPYMFDDRTRKWYRERQ